MHRAVVLILGYLVLVPSAFMGVTLDAIAQYANQSATSARSLWDHNGSVVYLVSNGSSREFYYDDPRFGMMEAGARPGSLLFRGRSVNGGYVGTAFMFNRRCGQIPYEVSGPILDNYERVVLRGQAPRIGSDCNIRGYINDTLAFTLLKSGGAVSSSGGPSNDYRSAQAVPMGAADQLAEEFLGVWTIEQASDRYCLKSDWDERESDGLLKITAQSVEGWEMTCKILNVKMSVPFEDKNVEVNLDCGGEGTTWRVIEQWSLRTSKPRKVLLQSVVKIIGQWDDAGKRISASNFLNRTKTLLECPSSQPPSVSCQELYDAGRIENAKTCYQVKAENGDIEAQFNLGKLYYHGERGDLDKKQAAAWFNTAADKGHAGAQSFLAVMYMTGQGVAKSPETAIKWYEKAAKAGDLSSAQTLAFLFKNGGLVKLDRDGALQWCQYFVDRQNPGSLPLEFKGGCEAWLSDKRR